MTPEQRELFRIAILRVLDANQTRFGLSAKAIATLIVEFGFQPQADAVTLELEYLADAKKGLAMPVDKKVSPENQNWKISADGRDFLAARGY